MGFRALTGSVPGVLAPNDIDMEDKPNVYTNVLDMKAQFENQRNSLFSMNIRPTRFLQNFHISTLSKL